MKAKQIAVCMSCADIITEGQDNEFSFLSPGNHQAQANKIDRDVLPDGWVWHDARREIFAPGYQGGKCECCPADATHVCVMSQGDISEATDTIVDQAEQLQRMTMLLPEHDRTAVTVALKSTIKMAKGIRERFDARDQEQEQ